jgi:lysophospholipase L1-like esterase
VSFAYNDWTRRERPFDLGPPGAVLIIGDSFTEGAGVATDVTFAARLGQKLERRVLNGGRRGLDQPALGAALEPLLEASRASVVVYAMTLNDYEQEPAWAAKQEYLNDLILDRQHMGDPTWKLPRLLRWSRLAQVLGAGGRSAEATAATVQWYRGMNGPQNAAGFARTIDDVVAMRDVTEAAGARFVTALLPLLVDFEAYPFEDLHRATIDALTARGVDAIDLLPAFAGADARSLWVHPVDMHPNARGHEIIAEALSAALGERLGEGGGRDGR